MINTRLDGALPAIFVTDRNGTVHDEWMDGGIIWVVVFLLVWNGLDTSAILVGSPYQMHIRESFSAIFTNSDSP